MLLTTVRWGATLTCGMAPYEKYDEAAKQPSSGGHPRERYSCGLSVHLRPRNVHSEAEKQLRSIQEGIFGW